MTSVSAEELHAHAEVRARTHEQPRDAAHEALIPSTKSGSRCASRAGFEMRLMHSLDRYGVFMVFALSNSYLRRRAWMKPA
jgi:hypothetical protein